MAERGTRPVVVVLVTAAVGLAACGDSSSPHVASLRTGSTSKGTGSDRPAASSTSAAPKGNATAQLDEWAACMRSHGDPNQADPTIDANKVIHITWDPAVPGGIDGTNKGGQGNSGPGQYCRAYLTAAETALQGGASEQPDAAQLLKFSECMQANGIADFPDPTGTTLSIPVNGPGDLKATNPTFRHASRLCAQKTGVPGFGGPPQPGMVELNGATPPGGAVG